MKRKQERNGNVDISTNMVDKIRTHDDQLPEKQFIIRNSVLTDLFENDHIRTVYHIFVATFMGLLVNTLTHDYFMDGEVKIGLKLISAAFKNVHLALLIWLGYYASTCVCYGAFIIWAKGRTNISPKSELLSLWDKAWLTALLGYYILSFRIAQIMVGSLDMQTAARAIVVLEQTRLLMKVHAFVRTNIGSVLSYKVHSDKTLKLPNFPHFVYFTFAPTLVYRDEYPRTKSIDWNHVARCLIECVGILFYYAFVLERLLHPAYQDFGLRKFTKSEIILSMVENSVTGILLLLGTFYLVLHCWQNLFAELLRFGDRMFYKDWWRCTSYSDYYRTWNVVVHDWLYAYVYKDMVQTVAPGRRVLGKFAVFLVSSIVHEWILTYMLGFCFPALFVQFFVFGTLLNFVKAPNLAVLNVIFWYSLALGVGMAVSGYAIEFYARKNVPKANETMLDFFVPRFLTCDCIE